MSAYGPVIVQVKWLLGALIMQGIRLQKKVRKPFDQVSDGKGT